MSENNKPELITTDVEVVAPEPYDFEFITNALGLIPYQALGLDNQSSYRGAFNPGGVIDIEICEDGNIAITLHGGSEVVMTADQFGQLEMRLRNMLNARQPMIVGIPPQGRRFQQ
jgi:hypothetical protein